MDHAAAVGAETSGGCYRTLTKALRDTILALLFSLVDAGVRLIRFEQVLQKISESAYPLTCDTHIPKSDAKTLCLRLFRIW